MKLWNCANMKIWKHENGVVHKILGVCIFAYCLIFTFSHCAAQAASVPRLAFQVYGVRDICEKDFVGTLKAAKAMGYEGVETGRFYGLDARGLKAACDEAGLELVALQLYPHLLVEPRLAETIRFCKEAGCRRINTAWFKGSAENENDWLLAVNVINHAAEVCAKEGIEVGYHNHDQEFLVRFDGKTAMEWMFERFSPLVKQEFDPGWCAMAGGDPVAWLAAHPHRNPTVHVMPAIGKIENGEFRMGNGGLPPAGRCGVGSVLDKADWRRIVPALVDDGVQWLVVKPTAYPDSLEDLKASCSYLKGLK